MKNYEELMEVNSFPTYQELLSTKEWQVKRQTIIKRDGNRCTKCNYAAIGGYAHFDEKTKMYSYIINDGSEQLTYVLDKNEDIIEAFIPNMIVTDKPYHLQVHHKYYILNRLPWEYSDEALITLCNWCHADLHMNEIIEMYENEDFANAISLFPCKRCNGVGCLEEYSYVNRGICFECKGQRFTIPLVNYKESN